MRVQVGRYTVVFEQDGRLHALRDGLEWRDCVGDKLILALAQEVEALREALKACVDAKDNAVWDAEGVSQDSVDRMLEVAEKARQVLVGN